VLMATTLVRPFLAHLGDNVLHVENSSASVRARATQPPKSISSPARACTTGENPRSMCGRSQRAGKRVQRLSSVRDGARSSFAVNGEDLPGRLR
jgi:hypothetical protein